VTDLLTRLVVWLDAAANAVGRLALAPAAVLPGWLSATLVAALTGVAMLAAFKYTSNQRAIRRARDDVGANLLALKLFPDSARVAARAQGRVLLGAARLFALALVPLAVLALPVTLLLGQLSLWYQQRPLRVGEAAVVTVTVGGAAGEMPEVRLEPTDAVAVTAGPVRVTGKREVCWEVRARQGGCHRLVFEAGGRQFAKELAVGDGPMRVSARRPAWNWEDALLHPAEPPFGPDAPVRSITIDYPPRESWTSGTGWWLAWWFAVSTLTALCFRRVLNVHV
jgi:hypothetical protein